MHCTPACINTFYQITFDPLKFLIFLYACLLTFYSRLAIHKLATSDITT